MCVAWVGYTFFCKVRQSFTSRLIPPFQRESKQAKDESEVKANDDHKRDDKVGDADGEGAASEAKSTGRELVRRVSEYFFDDGLGRDLEEWATSRLEYDLIAVPLSGSTLTRVFRATSFSPLDREYTLEQTALFREFREMLETRLERCVARIRTLATSKIVTRPYE